jgi:hypothetical protein
MSEACGAGVDRYGNPYNGRKRGRKKKERFGKKTLPSKLKKQREYYWKNRDVILKRRLDLVTNNPEVRVQEKVAREMRHIQKERQEQEIRKEGRQLKKAA